MTDYVVYKKGEKWVGEQNGAERASVSADTQAEAYEATRQIVENKGGGEISVHGVDGKIREKNTIEPAVDPKSTKG